jgi:hypothetical protein
MPLKSQLSEDTYVNKLINEVNQQTTTEQSPQMTIKLTDSQINQLEEISEVLGLAVGVMLNSVAKYAVFYAQSREIPVNQLIESQDKMGTHPLKVKLTADTQFRLNSIGMRDYPLESIMTGIHLLYERLIAHNSVFEQPTRQTISLDSKKSLIDRLVNSSPQKKRAFGEQCIASLGLEAEKASSKKNSCSVSGIGLTNGKKTVFYSNFRKSKLDSRITPVLSESLKQHEAEIALIFAVGYTQDFKSRLIKKHQVLKKMKIHLLTLDDYVNDSLVFKEALKDLPLLDTLDIERGLDRLNN